MRLSESNRSMNFYLSLGGNYDDSLVRIKRSIQMLIAHPLVSELRHAHFYSTRPIEVDSDKWFVNTVCVFRSTFSLHELFRFTQQIEVEMGKTPKAKTASRPIDIDILFMGEAAYQDDVLEVPHPHWMERLFVLVPLSDLTSEIAYRLEGREKRYDLKQLIDPLLKSTYNDILLLEENPNLYTVC